MITYVKALSYEQIDSHARELFEQGDTIFIGMVSPGETPPLRWFGGSSRVLMLEVYDTEHPVPIVGSNMTIDPISAEQIKQIADFLVFWNEDPLRWKLYVHCEAGQSRSGAVADVVQCMCDIPYEDFSRENPTIKPNSLIRRLLKRELGMVPIDAEKDS